MCLSRWDGPVSDASDGAVCGCSDPAGTTAGPPRPRRAVRRTGAAGRAGRPSCAERISTCCSGRRPSTWSWSAGSPAARSGRRRGGTGGGADGPQPPRAPGCRVPGRGRLPRVPAGGCRCRGVHDRPRATRDPDGRRGARRRVRRRPLRPHRVRSPGDASGAPACSRRRGGARRGGVPAERDAVGRSS